MARKIRWLALAVMLAGTTACCTGAFGPPPGLTHTQPHPLPKKRLHYRPPGGAAVDAQTVPVDGVGNAIVIGSPTPEAVASPSPSP